MARILFAYLYTRVHSGSIITVGREWAGKSGLMRSTVRGDGDRTARWASGYMTYLCDHARVHPDVLNLTCKTETENERCHQPQGTCCGRQYPGRRRHDPVDLTREAGRIRPDHGTDHIRHGGRGRCTRLRSVNGMDFRAEKIYVIRGRKANAVISGVFRKVQYIFFTDKLLECMDEEEIIAVFAHELAHAEHNYLPRMFMAVVLWLCIVQAVLYEIDINGYFETVDESLRNWAAGGLSTANTYLLLLLVLFPLSRRHEFQADATAGPMGRYTSIQASPAPPVSNKRRPETSAEDRCEVHHPT